MGRWRSRRSQSACYRIHPGEQRAGSGHSVFRSQSEAVIKSSVGDHKHALVDLQKLAAFLRSVSERHPFYYVSYHNSLASKLLNLGHLKEAEAAFEIAEASPYAAAYPEFADTKQQIQAAREATPVLVSIETQSTLVASPEAPPERLNHPKAAPPLAATPASETIASKGSAAPINNLLERLLHTINPRAR